MEPLASADPGQPSINPAPNLKQELLYSWIRQSFVWQITQKANTNKSIYQLRVLYIRQSFVCDLDTRGNHQ